MSTPTREPAPRWAVVGLAAVLLIAGCSADPQANDGGVPANPHGITATAVPESTADVGPGAGSATGSPDDGAAPSEAAESRADQRAVGAAAERAASYGFTQQMSATDTAIADTREQARLRQTNTSGTTVDPSECKAPLTAVDWSPILMVGADASRVDFGSETFAGTGTVEVASLADSTAVRQHREDVERLVADCPRLTMAVTDQDGGTSSFDFTARDSDATGDGVDSGLVWTRTPSTGGAPTTAQVLIGQTAGHVVMVSFIGGSEVAGEEFTTMAEQILTTTEGALAG